MSMSRNLPSAPAQGSSRRENGPSSKSRDHKPAVESAVTRLLVSIKQLLDSLNQWSNEKIDENAVSDVYVKLGNDFNAAVQAFAAFGIEMAELASVPDDLRAVLEQCLAEDASPENLELYLPTVRGIITNLLQGLRGKQSIYRRIVSDSRRSDSSSGHERSGSRGSSSTSHGSVGSVSRRAGSSHRSTRSVTEAESSRDLRRSAHSSSTSSRRRDNSAVPASPQLPTSAQIPPDDNTFIGGFSPSIVERRDLPDSSEPQFQAGSPPPAPAPEPHSPPPRTPSLTAPPNMKRYSLVDKPVPQASPSVVVEPSSPNVSEPSPPQPLPPAEPSPAMAASSLAALKQLERRASKRFSTYNISKMTGTARERPTRTPSNRRSFAASSALTPSELDTLTEGDDEEPPTKVNGSHTPRSVSPILEHPHIPPLPSVDSSPSRPSPRATPEPSSTATDQALSATTVDHEPRPPSSDTGRLTVFLQLGREVKKAVIEPGLSFSSLRVLFVDKFSYNPGKDNFPAIYIRDPSSGIQYELEDMEEVKDKCLLSLNIEPLDQIKQHIDSQITTLSQDIKDLRVAIGERVPEAPPSPFGAPLAESTPMPRPSDRQFQYVARRISRFVAPDRETASLSSPLAQMPQYTGGSLQAQMTGSSVISEYSNRVVADLKTQFDEVQNLRRDLGIMRQLYTEFMKQTKDSLSVLKQQTKSVKQIATSGVGGARGYIDTGKQKLDERSQNVLTDIEKLQDSVEQIRDDVLKRHTTPKVFFFKGIKKDISRVASEMQSLQDHISTIKPMWKKTWEEELQNIVEEQQFLTHQEEFLADLQDDHKALREVFGHIEQVISIRGTTVTPRGKTFRPPPAEEGHEGLSTVMMQLRGAQMDPEKRMKAIEANQKIREKELASQSDELHNELADFVSQNKLRMTGGAEEVERVRQKKSEQTLKAMFTGGSFALSDMSAGSSIPSSPVAP